MDEDLRSVTPPGTIGVTVGIGHGFSSVARLSAACFTENTGIPAVVLGQNALDESGFEHPAALRLRIFDLVDAETVVYFDADWLCLRKWTLPLDSPGIVAGRDFILREEWPEQDYQFSSKVFSEPPAQLRCAGGSPRLRAEYINEVREFSDLRLPLDAWINSGLMILHRASHARLLRTAERLYRLSVGHHDVYFEQPALLKAIEIESEPVTLLPRACNVLAAHERLWPDTVIGLHIKLRRHAQFLSAIAAGTITDPLSVRKHFTTPGSVS